jgi:hypothetical protein
LAAFEATGFQVEAPGGFVASVEGLDPTDISDMGYWGLYTSTTNGRPSGAPASNWVFAQVGADAGPTLTDQAYLFQVELDWFSNQPNTLTLAQVLGHRGLVVVPPSAPGQPAPGENPKLAAAWLGAQLKANGNVFAYNGQTDWGLTIDAMFALAAAGVGGEQLAATAAKLAASGPEYVGAPNQTATKWAALAKTVLALQVAGFDPTNFTYAGTQRNLVAELRGAMRADGTFGSGPAPFTHGFAVLALARTDGGVPPQAAAWLEAQACTDPTSPGYGGFAWSGPCGSPDADSTSMAVQALLAGGQAAVSRSADPGASLSDFVDTAVLDAAAGFLVAHQHSNGGFIDSWTGANANSTGLAAPALGLLDRATAQTAYSSALANAAGFTGANQVTCALVSASGALTEADLGAVAMNANALDEASEHGIDSLSVDQFRRSTAQGLAGFGGPSLGELTATGMAAGLPQTNCQAAPAPPSTPPASATTPPAATNPAPTADAVDASSPGAAGSVSGTGATGVSGAGGTGAMAVTGSNTLGLAGVAGVALAVGLALVRRRHLTDQSASRAG